MQAQQAPARLGIVGGLGALGAADVFHKLVQALPSGQGEQQAALLFEQRPFREGARPGDAAASQNGRKLYAFDMIRGFAAREVDAVLLPCFICHTFLEELQAEVPVPIVGLMAALRTELSRRRPGVRRLGILTSDYVRANGLFERHFPAAEWTLHHPRDPLQREGVMAAVYGPEGLKRGHLQGASVALLARACEDLLAQGAELIVPGFAEIPVVIDALRQRGLPILDVNQVYACEAVSQCASKALRPFKVGVVGGVGPAATADFMAKIVRNTPAGRDQDHVKVVVEQNPQIPDRTDHLLGDGADPTVALYATCKRLEAAEADIIAIPCNTAHAYVERLQPHLAIPVVDMLKATVEHLQGVLPEGASIGLLATSGTVRSGLYDAAAREAGFALQVPDEAHQARVMNAIYGDTGIKAGFTDGRCREDLDAALAHLVAQGVRAVILGCTELPLVLDATPPAGVAGETVWLVDPTDVLAKRCVALAVGPKKGKRVIRSS